MISARILAIPAAVLVVAVIIGVRGRGPSAAPEPASAPPQSQASSAVPPSPAAEPRRPAEAPPEIVFLEEAGTQTPSNRPRPTSQRMPAVNGTRRVVNARPITTKEQGEFVSPRWSPDGLELLVSRPGYLGLYTVGSNGGGVTQLTAQEGLGFGADWNETGEVEARTNDGKRKKFNPDGSPADSADIETDPSLTGTFTKDDTVFYRPAPGEAPIAVSSGEDKYFGGTLSPDGKYIAYTGLQTGIYIQPVDGSSPPVSVGAGTSPEWLPDSSGIVYQITTDDGHNLLAGDLYSATVDGQTVSNLTQTGDNIELHPAVSPDGTRIAFESDGVVYVGELQ